MRRDHLHQHPALAVRLAHEADVAQPQVAKAPVDELGGGARGGAGEVALVDERDVEPVGRRGLRDSGADDAAADDEQVEPPRPEAFECGYAVHSGLVQARRPARSAISSRP